MAFLDNTGVVRLVTDLKSKLAAIVHTHAASDITSGTLGVARGGTGKTTHTSNAVLTGDGTSAVKNVATADGALYATAANGAAQFGTLPVAQGGTAGTTEAEARASLEVPVNSSIAAVESTTATANHAVGDHFMIGEQLKLATAAIATGETINATNSTDATVQAQIDNLRDSVDRRFDIGMNDTMIWATMYTDRNRTDGLQFGYRLDNGKYFLNAKHNNAWGSGIFVG